VVQAANAVAGPEAADAETGDPPWRPSTRLLALPKQLVERRSCEPFLARQ